MSIPESVGCRGQSSRLYPATKYDVRRGTWTEEITLANEEVKVVKEAVSKGWKDGRKAIREIRRRRMNEGFMMVVGRSRFNAVH